MTDAFNIGEHYGRSRQRVAALLADAGPMAADVTVPTCPGWSVHDIVAHLFGIIEDAIAGRINGIPQPEQTDEQVQRHRDETLGSMLDKWAAFAPLFQSAITERQVWPALFDVISHEHDIRNALGDTGGRDVDTVLVAATRLIEAVDGPAIRVRFQDGAMAENDPATSGVEVYELTTTPFEVVRFRLGRRTAAQVRGLRWSQDPTPILDQLLVFGPAAETVEASDTTA